MAEVTGSPLAECFEAPMENAFLAVSMEVCGLPDSDGNRDLMSIRFVYAESAEDYQKKNFKKIKLFMPKYHAVPLAKMMLDACSDGEWIAPVVN